MSNDEKRITCERSDTGLVRPVKFFNLGTKSKRINTTEQIDFNDTTSPEFSDTTESGEIWENGDTRISDNTSTFADTTEGSNASKPEDAYRSGIINDTTNLPGPEPAQPTEGNVLIDCKNPDTTCINLSCKLHGPIGIRSRPYVSFSMSATTEDLGEFTSPYGVVKVRLL